MSVRTTACSHCTRISDKRIGRSTEIGFQTPSILKYWKCDETSDVDPSREHSAGVLFVGDPYTALQPAPIGVGPTQHVLTCPSACTAFEFAQDHEPITVFTEAFHMHETGVRAVNEQIRDGEVVRESSVDFFDFGAGGIQHARQEPFALQAGDGFRTS